MKRLFAILLTVILAFGLCACGESGAGAKKDGLYAGFGRVNITPEYTVQLGGGATTRLSTGYQDYLYATCIALTKKEETYLIYTLDFICAEDVFVDPAKKAINEATGVPEENILMNATHTHASVAIRSNGTENVERYREDFNAWATEAAQLAIADQSAAEVYYGSTQTEKMNNVRHYVLSNGTYAGSNFGDFGSGTIVDHTTEADGELQMVRFARAADDKKDIAMMNFPTHATMNQSNTTLSADFPAPTRDYIEANTDSLVAYFIAAAGDQAPTGKIPEDNYSTDYKVYGQRLGQYVVDALPGLTKLDSTDISYAEQTFTTGYNKEKLDQLDNAKQVKAIWDQYGRASVEGKKAATDYGFASIYEVSAVINRASAPDTNSMDIKVMSVGDIGFAFAPYEMFSTEGIYIKENSPFAMTFIVTCAEGAEGYLPSELGWEIGSYESHVSKFQRGTAEKVAEEFVSMLTELKNAQ